MKVFISYRREDARWIARAVKQALEQRQVEVFLDIENINAGRFENVILDEIGSCEHFIALLTAATARALGAEGDWVTRELQRALELGKNVIPTLVDDASVADISAAFPRRKELLELNFFRLSSDLFDQAIAVLVDRFLTQPSLREVRIRTAEEHFQAGMEALQQKSWRAAEAEFDKAVALRARPEYFLGKAAAKEHLGRGDEALQDLEVAISLDPFAFELMKVKFDLLQRLDREGAAIDFWPDWRRQARMRAFTLGARIIERLDQHDDIVTAVRSVPELTRIFDDRPLEEEIGASLEVVVGHTSGDVHDRLEAELTAWRIAHGRDG